MYLLIDTGLQNDKLSIQAHISRPVSLKGKHVATEFVELVCTVQMEDAEKVGCTCGADFAVIAKITTKFIWFHALFCKVYIVMFCL